MLHQMQHPHQTQPFPDYLYTLLFENPLLPKNRNTSNLIVLKGSFVGFTFSDISQMSNEFQIFSIPFYVNC